jgi:2-oxoglutarate ferredoxin oxidoreductase subunit beta
MKEAVQKSGFTFVEIISPCPTLYGRRNKLGDGLEMMREFKAKSIVKNGADTREVGLDFKGSIVCGKFVDRDRPAYLNKYNERMAERLGASFVPYEGLL